MAVRLRKLIVSAQNHSSSHCCGFEPSSGHMWDKPTSSSESNCLLVTRQNDNHSRMLAGCQVFFLGDLPFSPHLSIDSAQNERNNLDGP